MNEEGLGALGDLLDEVVAALGSSVVFGAGAIALSIVFLLSAWPKLRRPRIAAMAINDFGIGGEARPWAGLVLGGAELTLAALLLLSSKSDSSAFRVFVLGLASIVLWTFSALIMNALRSHREFACRCFGGDTSPISSLTLMRTGLLALGATVLCIAAFHDFGSAGINDWLAELIIGGSLLAAVALLGSLRSLMGAGR